MMWLSWAVLLDYSILLVMQKIRQFYRKIRQFYRTTIIVGDVQKKLTQVLMCYPVL